MLIFFIIFHIYINKVSFPKFLLIVKKVDGSGAGSGPGSVISRNGPADPDFRSK